MKTKLPTPQELCIKPCEGDKQEALYSLRHKICNTPLPLPKPLRNAAEMTLRELVCKHKNPNECWLPLDEHSQEVVLLKTERPWKGLCITASETFYVAEGEGQDDALGVVSELSDHDFITIYLEAMPEQLPSEVAVVWSPDFSLEDGTPLNKADDVEGVLVYLDEVRTPIAWGRKYNELIEQGMNDKEARETLSQPFELELYYSIGCGLFAVEQGAVECGVIFDPYTARECPPCRD